MKSPPSEGADWRKGGGTLADSRNPMQCCGFCDGPRVNNEYQARESDLVSASESLAKKNVKSAPLLGEGKKLLH